MPGVSEQVPECEAYEQGNEKMFRQGKVRLGYVRLGQVRLGYVRLGQVRLGQVRVDKFKGCFGWLGKFSIGWIINYFKTKPEHKVRLAEVMLG